MSTESSPPAWLVEDSARRKGRYKRNASDESFLFDLNARLREVEQTRDNELDEPKPAIFLLGVPRAGKTLFSQCVSFGLDIGYIDNIVARFWLAPTHGIRLSRAIAPFPRGAGSESVFRSDYGKTAGPLGPHDFSYFWHHWLNINGQPHDPIAAESGIDFEGLARELGRITGAFERVCAFKSPNPGFHIEKIAAAYPESLFIHIKRDPIDSALSLLKGRIDNYGSPDSWYGQYPIGHEPLLGLPYPDQIAGQLKGLIDMVDRPGRSLPDVSGVSRFMEVWYDDFCGDPRGILRSISDRLDACFGVRPELNRSVPGSFGVSKRTGEEPGYRELFEALERTGLPPRRVTQG